MFNFSGPVNNFNISNLQLLTKKGGLCVMNKSLGQKWTMINSWCPNFETVFIKKSLNHGDAYNAFSGRCWHINAAVFIIVQLLWFGFTSCLYDPWINHICIKHFHYDYSTNQIYQSWIRWAWIFCLLGYIFKVRYLY